MFFSSEQNIAMEF